MSIRVNSALQQELRHYGKGDWNECFHCGNCTAVCPLTADGELFPRKAIRQLQMGLTDKLAGSLEPWLCYYCGDCSRKCPRGAEPGELMMTLRRWQINPRTWLSAYLQACADNANQAPASLNANRFTPERDSGPRG